MSKLSIKITPKFRCIAELPGYEDYNDYDIYRDGRVYSRKSKRFLTDRYTKYGYIRIRMYRLLESDYVVVHRLVALAFIPNPDNLKFVDHINGIRDDNRVDNLRWATHANNQQNRIIAKRNTTGEECIHRDHQKRKNYTDYYWRIVVTANGSYYREHYNIGKLPLDATQDEIDELYHANPITKEMTDRRDYLKELYHGQFSSTHRKS